MKHLSQRDPSWSWAKLGRSPLTVGRFGCTTTCISMALDYFGIYKSPLRLSEKADLYTPDGLIVWGELPRLTGMKAARVYGRDDAKIRESLKDPRKAVILQVDGGSHWIIAKRRTLFGNDYVCQDPWDGKECVATRKYRNITGSAHLEVG